jgi:hypothetical protein
LEWPACFVASSIAKTRLDSSQRRLLLRRWSFQQTFRNHQQAIKTHFRRKTTLKSNRITGALVVAMALFCFALAGQAVRKYVSYRSARAQAKLMTVPFENQVVFEHPMVDREAGVTAPVNESLGTPEFSRSSMTHVQKDEPVTAGNMPSFSISSDPENPDSGTSAEVNLNRNF